MPSSRLLSATIAVLLALPAIADAGEAPVASTAASP